MANKKLKRKIKKMLKDFDDWFWSETYNPVSEDDGMHDLIMRSGRMGFHG